MPKEKILVIDDEKLIRWSLEQELRKEGYDVLVAETGDEGFHLFSQESPDLTILDIKLPDADGMEVLEKIKSRDKDHLTIMITAFGDVGTAVRAMKLGAYDYLTKPFELEEVKLVMEKALESQRFRQEVSEFKRKERQAYGIHQIIGSSPAITKVLETVRKISETDTATVFIEGESGVGKELVARSIHYQSQRGERPFMEIDCSALPETLIESELFGHEKGAFTDAKAPKKGLMELADGGTAFLDEIGDMSLATQGKILRVIETKILKKVGGTRDIQVNIRIIAATNKDLGELVKQGKFREDLYFRLKVIPIFIPPLRERKEDILPLAKHFIEQFNREFRKNVRGLSAEAEKALLSYHWPGNVRELKNVIERTILLEGHDILLPEHLVLETKAKAGIRHWRAGPEGFRLPEGGISLEDAEKELLKQALERASGNQTQAAKLLRISRDTLRYRMKKHHLL